MEKQRRYAQKDGKQRGRATFVDGSTVRRLEAQPDLRRRQRIEEEKNTRAERNQRNRRRRNQQRALALNRGYILFLGGAVAIMLGIMAYAINLQADIGIRIKNVAELENQIQELKSDNDTREKKLDSSIDLETIKNTAIQEYGMTYPQKGQIVPYDVKNNDHMNQYEEIPTK